MFLLLTVCKALKVSVSVLQCHVAWVISLSLGPVFRAGKHFPASPAEGVCISELEIEDVGRKSLIMQNIKDNNYTTVSVMLFILNVFELIILTCEYCNAVTY